MKIEVLDCAVWCCKCAMWYCDSQRGFVSKWSRLERQKRDSHMGFASQWNWLVKTKTGSQRWFVKTKGDSVRGFVSQWIWLVKTQGGSHLNEKMHLLLNNKLLWTGINKFDEKNYNNVVSFVYIILYCSIL